MSFSSENDYIVMSFQVRDYIHVVDLADGHIAALQKLSDPSIGVYLLFFYTWFLFLFVFKFLVRC